MKYLALVTFDHSEEAVLAQKKTVEERKEGLKDKPREEWIFPLPEGVRLIEGGGVFGRFSMVFIYEAPDEGAAWKFLSWFRKYAKVERFQMIPCPWCDRTKAYWKKLEANSEE